MLWLGLSSCFIPTGDQQHELVIRESEDDQDESSSNLEVELCDSTSLSPESKHLIQGDNLDVRAEPCTPPISKKVHFDQELSDSISTRASTIESDGSQQSPLGPRGSSGSSGSTTRRTLGPRGNSKTLLKVGEFLRKNGFQDVDSKRKTYGGLSCTYPLHVAAEQNDTKMVLMLLRLGANPNEKDGRGRTPDECVKNKLTHVEVHSVLQCARLEKSHVLPMRTRCSYWDAFFSQLEMHPLAQS